MADTMKDRLIKKFEDEIQTLDRELKLELPKEIKRARELGDLRENAEYTAAKERQRLVESRISMLQKRVSEIALHQRRSDSDRPRRLRIDAARRREQRREAGVSARHARGRRRRQGPHLDDVADRPRVSEQGTRRLGKVVDARRHARVRDRQAPHDPRRSAGMTDPRLLRRPPDEPYSPQRRTALVLTGTGTAGAYHAGVLRALHEAGVKIDIVAGRGIGVVGALFAAVDGAQRLWDEKGFWRSTRASAVSIGGARRRGSSIVGAGGCRSRSSRCRCAAMAVGLIVFPIDFVLKMVGAGGAAG